MRQTLASVTEIHPETIENQDSLFSKQEAKLGLHNDHTSLFENLYAISVKKKANRSKTDQKVICQALKTIKFFADMQKDDMDFDSFLLRSFDLMEHEAYEKDDALFHLGDSGDKFYIILKGSIDVFQPKTQEEIMNDSYLESEHKRYQLNLHHIRHNHLEAMNSDSSSDRTPKKRKSTINPSSKRQIPSHEEIGDEQQHAKKGGKRTSVINTIAKLKVKNSHYTNHLSHLQLFSKFPEKKNLYIENGHVKFRKVRTMEAGACFGEIALSSDMCRGATVIASSELHVATLSKSAYKQIFKNVETSLKAKWNFFSELLKGTTKETITKFCYTFKERVYKFNQKIIEEGDIPRHVFVIHEGEVQVVKQEKKDEKSNNDELKFFKKQKKVSEKKIVNLGSFSFFGEGEALNHKKPYEYSAVSMANNTVIYSTSIKEFNTLRMDHGDVFLKIFNKHQAKMEHWNVRTSFNLYNSVNMEDINGHHLNSLLDGHTKSHSPAGVLRSHFQNTHSSKFIGERFKMMLNRESFRDSLSGNDNSTTTLSREDYSAERKKLPYENKPGTVTSASIFNQNKLVKFFDHKKENGSSRERPSYLKGSLRDLKKDKKSMFVAKEEGDDYVLDDVDGGQKLSIERFMKRKALNSKTESSATSLLVSPKHYLPHESDLEKIRLKTNASPIRRMNFRKLDSLTHSYDDETPKNLISLIGTSSGGANKLDITGNKLLLDEIKEQEREREKTNFDFRKFLNTVVSNKTSNQFWSPKNDEKKSKSKDSVAEKNSKKLNSPGLVKRNHLTLQLSKFPVFDQIPTLAKLESFGVTGAGLTTGSYEDLDAAAASIAGDFYPRPKDKTSTMISSKHNLFRMKPKKAFLEYSHYLSPTSTSLSSSPQKNHRNLRYKK